MLHALGLLDMRFDRQYRELGAGVGDRHEVVRRQGAVCTHSVQGCVRKVRRFDKIVRGQRLSKGPLQLSMSSVIVWHGLYIFKSIKYVPAKRHPGALTR
jgi:hypothetical protein